MSISYFSDTMYVLNTRYTWTLNGSASNNIQRGAGTDSDSQTFGGGFSHSLGKNHRLTPASSLSWTATESINASKASVDESTTTTTSSDDVIYGLGHYGRVSWSHSGAGSSTTAWVSASDRRTSEDNSVESQTYEAHFSRQETLSRLSSLNGSVFVRVTTTNQDDDASSDDGDDTNTGGSIIYHHRRLFGIHRMTFNSDLSLLEASAFNIDGTTDTQYLSTWRNKIIYNIGLLSTGIQVDYFEQSTRDSRIQGQFTVTRRF
jgi:hypothetical protein